jgi:hypothetical protein
MKDKIVLFIAGCFALALSSCLGDGFDYNYELSKDAQIYKFHLKSDSLPQLDSVKFSIDQYGQDGYGLIYNPDSMPFGTVIKEKVICTMNLKGAAGIQVVQTALIDKEKEDTTEKSDTIWWNMMDSLDFTAPVWFIVYAQDQVTTKRYLAQINIHQVKPDSMVWRNYLDPMIPEQFVSQTVLISNDSTQYYLYAQIPTGETKLYTSPVSDLKIWTPAPLTNFPAGANLPQMCKYKNTWVVSTPEGKIYTTANGRTWSASDNTSHEVAAILGSTSNFLSVIVKEGGAYYFAKSTDLQTWTLSADKVDDHFPLTGFARASFDLMFESNILLAGGRKIKDNTVSGSVWISSDGFTWAPARNAEKAFTPCEGASLTTYDDSYYLIGGIDAKGNAIKTIYTSKDYGLHWTPIDSMKMLPAQFEARGYASIEVTKENNLFLFGGKAKAATTQPSFNQIWTGRINRLAIKSNGFN